MPKKVLVVLFSLGWYAFGQGYFKATIGYSALTPNGIFHVTGTDTCGNGNDTVEPTNLDIKPADILLLPTLPLVKTGAGKWIPASASSTGPGHLPYEIDASPTDTLQSSVSSSGIATTVLTGTGSATYSGLGNVLTYLGTASGMETIDLNTGRYTWQYQETDTFSESISQSGIPGCTDRFTTSFITLSQTEEGIVPISYAPGTFTPTLSAVNPFAPYIARRLAPPTVDPTTLVSMPPATRLAADGLSAAVLLFQSASSDPVTFSLSSSGGGIAPNTAIGTLAAFDANYLIAPKPPSGEAQQLQVAPNSCDSSGVCTFLALLWGPGTMPLPNIFPIVQLTVTASQPGLPAILQITMALMPPPLLLVHGIWSSADQAWPLAPSGFPGWLAPQYPHDVILRVDYEFRSALEFDDAVIQSHLMNGMDNALAKAAAEGMVARQVDVVAHSMGGLVTRYFLSQGPPLPSPELLPNPVHKLITIGTPHLGTQVATNLELNQNVVAGGSASGAIVTAMCANPLHPISPCTLSNVLAAQGKVVNSGVQSLEPASTPLQALSSTNTFSAVEGLAPGVSTTELELNLLVGAFLPGETIESILGTTLHDTLVPSTSQSPPQSADSASVYGIVHTSLGPPDIGETRSESFWQQAYYWLTGGSGTAPATSGITGTARAASASPKPLTASSANAPLLDLTGYTQVAASNVSISPPSGSILTINEVNTISATSSNKTIIQLLLLQTVQDFTDTFIQFVQSAPFGIQFTPTRLGSAAFTAIVTFQDNTYASVPLTYALQPSAAPIALTLWNAPIASMALGNTAQVRAVALFPDGTVDVTAAASFASGSGTTSVFAAAAGGQITAEGTGQDSLIVAYSGLTASAPIAVGACSYSLSPVNQTVPAGGGTLSIQVNAPAGCAWSASATGSWFTITGASGTGDGTITLSASANNTASPQTTLVTLGSQSASVAEASANCSYVASPTSLAAPAAGITGSIMVTTSCPIVPSSNASWATVVPGDSSVYYSIAANTGATRTAVLTIGSISIPVSQSAYDACDVNRDGNTGVSDVQSMINEALGVGSEVNDLNGDGVVNVVDLQIVINAALGLECSGS